MSWCQVSGSPDYVTADGKLVAIYKHSHGGHAAYWVFRAELPVKQRRMSNALCVGGLPTDTVTRRLGQQS